MRPTTARSNGEKRSSPMSRWRGIFTFLVFACVLCGAVGAYYLLDWHTRSDDERLTLSHNAVMQRFRSRSTPEELRRFEQLASADDSLSKTRATEMALFKL